VTAAAAAVLPRPSRRHARLRRRLLRRVLAVLGFLAFVAVVAGSVLFAATPWVGGAEDRVQAVSGSHGAGDDGAAVPSRFAAALVATEDSRFYSHHGLDTLGVARAVTGTIAGASADPGGSTLDQQLAKELYSNGLSSTLADKVEQVTLAVKLDTTYSKSQVLEMYAASVYFGHGFYGLHAAACGYFATAPANLSWAQASLLAGLPQAPSAYDPLTHPQLARERQHQVLDRLVAVADLTPAAAAGIARSPWGLTGAQALENGCR